MSRSTTEPRTGTRAGTPRALRPARRRAGRWYLPFVACVGVSTVCASLGVGVLMGYLNSLPPIERLENYSPAEVSIVYDSNGDHIAQFSSERRQVIPLEKIPRQLINAFLAIEDDRFAKHYGVDPRSMARTAVVNQLAGRVVQGGSTITMQLPRNILSETVGRERTIERKIKEILLAFQIERRYSKDQILEFYLNQIFLGRNSYGVRAAAETYFNKVPEELTLAECATLAGIPKGPSVYNPLANPERSKKRRDLVLRRLRQLQWISQEEYDAAIVSPLETRSSKRLPNVLQSEFPYFVDGLYRELTGYYKIRQDQLREDGLKIFATIDPEMQRIAETRLAAGLARTETMWHEKKGERFWIEADKNPGAPRQGQSRLMQIMAIDDARTEIEVALEDYTGRISLPETLPYYNPGTILRVGELIDIKIRGIDYAEKTLQGALADVSRIQGSIAILDARTGSVLALVGGADFRDTANRGQYNRALLGGRAAGSTVKPFFYAAALKQGYGPHMQIVDEPVRYPSIGADYVPKNFEQKFFGPTTLIDGLTHSRNVVTIRLFEAMGVGKALRDVVRFDPRPENTAWRKRFRPELPVSLGSVDMNVYELAAAYQVFVNHGVERRPHWFTSVLDRQGNATLIPDVRESVVLDPVAAYQIVYMLRQVVERGSGRRAIGSRFGSDEFPPIAGKTGTTDGTTDAWFVGFTPDLLMACHVGFDAPRTLGPQMTGGRVAGPIWADIFQKILATRPDWTMQFELPRGITTTNICVRTGKVESDMCAMLGHPIHLEVPYRTSEVPKEKCDGFPREPLIPLASLSEGWAQPNLEYKQNSWN